MGDIRNRDIDDEAAAVALIRVATREHRVVMILRIDGVDGHQRHIAPVFAVSECCRPSFLGLGNDFAAEYARNAVRVDGDQAYCAFALERAKLFSDARSRQAVTTRTRDFRRDQVTVLCVVGSALGDRQFAALAFLVDRYEPAATAGQCAKNAENAMPRAVDDLDNATGVVDVLAAVGVRIDLHQRMVTDAGYFPRRGLARYVDMDFGSRAVFFAVPFRRCRRSVPRRGRGR